MVKLGVIVQISGKSVPIQANSLDIDDAIGERSTCSFYIVDERGTSHYRKGQPVQIWNQEGFLVFGGVIESAQEQKITPDGTLLHYIRCTDWHYLADKRIAAKAYKNMTAGAIVQDLVSSYLADEGVIIVKDVGFYFLSAGFPADFEDIDAPTVQDGPVVKEAVFNYVPVSDCLDALAEKTGFWWRIDPFKRLYFVPKSANAAPWNVTGADILYDSVIVEHGNPKYRNKQYVKGGRDITDIQVETKVGDGESRSFTVGFPIAKVPTIEVSRNGEVWEQQTVGIKGKDTGYQFYWSKGDSVIKQDDNETVLSSSDKVRITYQGEYSIVVITYDKSAIEDRKQVEGSGSGIVEDVVDEPHSTDREAAFQLANKKLEKYAVIGRRLKFRTQRTGLKPGQLLIVNLPEHDLNNVEMLIESVAISDEDAKIIWYDVTAVEGPQTGSWSKMFYNMATRGQAFVIRENISEDEVLIILEQVNESWSWGESVNVSVFSCPVPSDTLYPSETLYPC